MGKRIPVITPIHSKWKSQCGRYTVSVTNSCFIKMLELYRQYFPKEIGSSLIGYYSNDGFDAYVLDIAPISSDSIAERFSLYRGIEGLLKFFRKLVKAHHGQIYYIGEWHSHPNGVPIPSNTDDVNQIQISNDPKTNCPESILVILGGNFIEKPEIGVFVYPRKKNRIKLHYEKN